jgi:hypothetical protein
LNYSKEARQQLIAYIEAQIKHNPRDAELREILERVKTDDKYFRLQINQFNKRIKSGEYDQYKRPSKG